VPRGFSGAERERIRGRLYEQGERLFAARGVRRTTVDEIARAAGIAKGSFYRFAASKEEFFFDLLEHAEAGIRAEIEQALARAEGGREERVRVVLERAAGVMHERPLFRILTDPEELAYLARGVPAGRLAEHAQGDAAYFERVLGELTGGTASPGAGDGAGPNHGTGPNRRRGDATGDGAGANAGAGPNHGDGDPEGALTAEVAAGLIKVLVMLPSLEGFIGPEVFPAVRRRLSRYIADGLAKEPG
jgi:AcrR family transcriptional regulator